MEIAEIEHPPSKKKRKRELPVAKYVTVKIIISCIQPPHAEVTKLLCPHHDSQASGHWRKSTIEQASSLESKKKPVSRCIYLEP